MSANINPDTGIPYGVIDARDVSELWEEITRNGTSLSYEAFKAELVKKVRAAIDAAEEEEEAARESVLCRGINDILVELGYRNADRVAEEMAGNVEWSDDADSEEQAKEIVDGLDDLGECFNAEEEEYIWSTSVAIDNQKHPVRYQLGYLGGAGLIWVLQSPWRTLASRCSPCVPNAGDLNNPDAGGLLCYDINPLDYAAEVNTRDAAYADPYRRFVGDLMILIWVEGSEGDRTRYEGLVQCPHQEPYRLTVYGAASEPRASDAADVITEIAQAMTVFATAWTSRNRNDAPEDAPTPDHADAMADAAQRDLTVDGYKVRDRTE